MNDQVTKDFVAAFQELSKKLSEIEAKKTPEQRAEDQRRWRAQREAAAHAKAEKKRITLINLYTSWCLRDTWLVEGEAMHLIAGRDPSDITIFDAIDGDLWEVVKSCVGHSLKVINPNDKASKWRVKTTEWLRWITEKGYPFPLELKEVLFPPTLPSEKIAPAQNAREQKKRDRLTALRAFISVTTERARKNGTPFDIHSIPVTKEDFLKVFYRQYPQIEKISPDTFDHDIRDIGLKFKRGTKSNKNNVLAHLFS